MKSNLLKWLFGIFAAIAIFFVIAYLNRDTLEKNAVKNHFSTLQAESLAQPFRGIESRTGKIENLFPIQSTGVSTRPIQLAATAFVESLTDEQRAKTLYPIDDEEWRMWCNVDNGIYVRQGTSLKEMSTSQKELAFQLMQTSLSAKGLQLSKDIMKTDQSLRELQNDSPDFDEELYFFTLMGTPDSTQPWGWQVDGHHLVINYFVLGDQVVMAPVFMGAEPVFATSGKYEGNELFQDEQNLGLAFMQSLPQKLQESASLSHEKTHNHNETEAFKDNVTLDFEGLVASQLDSVQAQELQHLIEQYVHNIREGHQQVKMEEVLAHWDETWFAWHGKTDEDAVFYYRIHSPVMLIEFDHQSPVGVPSEAKGPVRNHIHTVVRTPNGNDYGKDLLRQHLEQHHH